MHDERYAGIESLRIVIDRMLPYGESDIIPSLKDGNTVSAQGAKK